MSYLREKIISDYSADILSASLLVPELHPELFAAVGHLTCYSKPIRYISIFTQNHRAQREIHSITPQPASILMILRIHSLSNYILATHAVNRAFDPFFSRSAV